MWDNREGKRNPKAPDFKCKDRGCGGVIWPPRDGVRVASAAGAAAGAPSPAVAATAGSPVAGAGAAPACPICGGPMWDDRATKRNPRAPDFKCKNRPRERGGPGCEGVIWPPREGSPSPYPPSPQRARPAAEPPRPRSSGPVWDSPPPPDDAPPHTDDDLPF